MKYHLAGIGICLASAAGMLLLICYGLQVAFAAVPL